LVWTGYGFSSTATGRDSSAYPPAAFGRTAGPFICSFSGLVYFPFLITHQPPIFVCPAGKMPVRAVVRIPGGNRRRPPEKFSENIFSPSSLSGRLPCLRDKTTNHRLYDEKFVFFALRCAGCSCRRIRVCGV
jgi:hypothetical protein